MKDYFSGNDIERYAYCPLNYLLYLKGVEVKSERGEKYHSNVIGKIAQNILIGKRVKYLGTLFYLVIFMTLIILTLFFYYMLIGSIDYLFLLFISIISVYAALWFYLLSNFFNYSIFKKMDSVILFLSIFSLLFLFISVSIFKFREIVVPILILSADLLLMTSSYLYYRLLKDIRILEKIPPEEKNVKYIDNKDSELLRSDKWKIQGRPDIIAEINGEIVPIEIKSSNMPKVRPFSHIMQLTAYAILVEEKYGKRVYYGILKYPQGNMEVEIDENLRETLRSLIQKMEEVKRTNVAHRNHNNRGKCQGCYRNKSCPESLA